MSYVLYWVSLSAEDIYVLCTLKQDDTAITKYAEMTEKYPNAHKIIPIYWGTKEMIEDSPYYSDSVIMC